jgi:hypothetical protein
MTLEAIFCMVSSFFKCLMDADPKVALAYSSSDLIRAVYAILRSSLGKCGAARAIEPSTPRALLTVTSMCAPNVKCRSRVTPSSFTDSEGDIAQPSKLITKSVASFLDGDLKIIN